MVDTGIEQALAIGDEDAEERAKFEQLMPIAIVARQSGSLQRKHRSGQTLAD